jgi:hypothetical protein
MNEALTAALTVFAGFVVFVSGQIVQRFLLEPIQEQRRVIGEIAYVLLYHDNVGRFTTEDYRGEVGYTLRSLAGELRRTRSTIPLYRLLEKTTWVVKTDNVMTAATGLVGWSNSVIGGDEGSAAVHKDSIAENLKILRP